MDAAEEGAHAAAFLAAVSCNASLMAVLDRVASLALPGACLAGGCLFQTVWNHEHDLPAAHGIADYDVFYFDPADLTAEREAAVARRVHIATADLGVAVDVRNQARVHLWYEAEYGAPSPPFRSCEEGIDHFLAPCCAFGLRREDGRLQAYAPFGYADLFSLTVRPNPRRAGEATLRAAYERKVHRWLQAWPRLRVMPWA